MTRLSAPRTRRIAPLPARRPLLRALAVWAVATMGLAAATVAQAQERFIVMASTTSTEQSGLFAHLLPAFKQASGVDVRVVAVGTGQALDTARRGDADVVLVHDTVAEEKFVAEGWSTARKPVMYNDFVLIGPAADPARLRGGNIASALKALAAGPASFISRGDKSGTHAAELRLWKTAGVDLAAAKPAGYKECGCGMGPALNIAASSGAYVLA
ncbi:MAG: tungsten ABC transporter substrate-binding protein, partial [Burkholderiales bacterium PBB5]